MITGFEFVNLAAIDIYNQVVCVVSKNKFVLEQKYKSAG